MIKPLYLSKEIFELASLGSEISLHSIFNSSINLGLNGFIINISDNQHILPPYGIVLKSKDFITLKNELNNKNLNLNIDNNTLSINNITIDLIKVAQKYISRMVKTTNKILDSNIEILKNKVLYSEKKNGFNIESSIILKAISTKNNLEKGNLYNMATLDFILKLNQLEAFFFHNNHHESLKYFLGRGMGLTPSGDDFLVGMMSVFSLHGMFKESIMHIRDFILKNKGIYTNDISEQFLIMATEDQFSISIILLIDYLTREEFDDEILNNVLNYGGTSGVDIILGIIFATHIMNRSGVNE